MMASYLQPFPSAKLSKPSQVSHIHLDLIWLPLFMLWSSLSFLFNPPPVFSSFPFLLSTVNTPNSDNSLIHSLSTQSLQPAAVLSLSSSHLSSFLILLLCFISSLKCLCPFICTPSLSPPPNPSPLIPPFIQPLSTNNRAFPPGSSGQRSPHDSPRSPRTRIPPPASEQTEKESEVPSQGPASTVTLLRVDPQTVAITAAMLLRSHGEEGAVA